MPKVLVKIKFEEGVNLKLKKNDNTEGPLVFSCLLGLPLLVTQLLATLIDIIIIINDHIIGLFQTCRLKSVSLCSCLFSTVLHMFSLCVRVETLWGFYWQSEILTFFYIFLCYF